MRQPNTTIEARNNILGLTTSGNIVDPCNWMYAIVSGGINCSEVNPYFWASGDPVLNVGWISTTQGDVRNIQSVRSIPIN